MTISIYTEILPREFQWSPREDVPSGTVEFYIATAEELSKNNEVIVYYDGDATHYKNVYYLPREMYGPSEINIHCNDRASFGKRNIYWTNKIDQKAKDYMDYDHRITISKYHKSIFGDSTIIGHGIYPEFYKSGKKENICLYSSSPDRAGEVLNELEPHITSLGYKLIRTYSKAISEREMIDLYAKSRFWLHPCQGVELFCISAVKAQASGCIPIVVPNMALAETVKTGIKCELKDYKDELINALKNPPKIEKYTPPSWEDVTCDIVKLF